MTPGPRRLYDWMDRNRAIASYAADYTNHPQVIARHDSMVSITNAIEVDLYGQVAGSRSALATWRDCASAAGPGSVLVLVLERKLKLGPEGDRAALIQVEVLPDHFSDPQVMESLACGLDRLRCRVFP